MYIKYDNNNKNTSQLLNFLCRWWLVQKIIYNYLSMRRRIYSLSRPFKFVFFINLIVH